jgi:hypothetical protein
VQVTNPPIDPLREGLVMSLEMRLGGRGNLLNPGADTYRQVSRCKHSAAVQLYTCPLLDTVQIRIPCV